MIVPHRRSIDDTLSTWMAFLYTYDPRLIFSSLRGAKIRYSTLTGVHHGVRREICVSSLLNQGWCLFSVDTPADVEDIRPAAEGVTASIRTGFCPGNLTLLITILAIMLDIASASEVPHVRIRASEPGPLIDVPELLRFRDLLWTLAERDLKVRYKQTALGVIWVVLQPLMAALIFTFVFGFIAGLPSDGEPYLVFAFAGMTAWNTFANVLTRVSSSLVANGGMLSKIYFPRLILPLSSVISALVDSSFSLVLMFVMMAIYRVWPGMGHRVLAGLAADPGGPGTRSGTDDLFVDGALSRRRARHSGAAPARPVHQPGGLVDDEPQAQ